MASPLPSLAGNLEDFSMPVSSEGSGIQEGAEAVVFFFLGGGGCQRPLPHPHGFFEQRHALIERECGLGLCLYLTPYPDFLVKNST